MSLPRAFRARLVGGQAASNLVLDGLKMYLDGGDTSTMTLNGSRLDAWTDKMGLSSGVATSASGVGSNPTYDSALFGGQGGVTFSSKYLETAANFTALDWSVGFTILVAGQLTDTTSFFCISDGAGLPVVGKSIDSRMGSSSNWRTSKGFKVNTSAMFGANYNGVDLKAIFNGESFATRDGAPSVGSSTFGKLQIGGLVPGGFGNFTARAIFVYNRVLTAAELTKMKLYFQQAYSFASIADPLYNIVADGSRFISCVGSTSTYSVYGGVIAANGPPNALDYVNMSLDNQNTDQMRLRAAADIDPLLISSYAANRKIIIVSEVTNNLSDGGSAVDTYASLKTYCQARKSAGWGKIIVLTCLPRSNGGLIGTFEVSRQTVNASIVANAVSEGWADYVADIGADATIGVAGASNDATYYAANKIHLNSTGQAIAKTYITAGLNAVTV